MPRIKRSDAGDVQKPISAICNDGTLCYGETACDKRNGVFVCICFHYNEPPVNGWECKRNVVTPDPRANNLSNNAVDNLNHGSSPIKVQILSSGGLAKPRIPTPTSSPDLTSSHEETFQMAIPLIALTVSLFSLLVVALCFLKRKSLKRIIKLKSKIGGKGDKKPDQLNQSTLGGGLLVPSDRFVMNPTYESSHLLDLAIPVFLPSEINEMVQIGQGCFGKVYKADMNGELVAVKVVKGEHSAEALGEMETMSSFNHPNILRMIGVAKSIDMEAPWLIFEYMEYGDLASVLRNIPNNNFNFRSANGMGNLPFEQEKPLLYLSKESLTDISYQIAEGMKYLSSQHFVHRDLAARNCLVGRNGVVKISDFGLSRDVYTCDYYKIGGSRLLPIRWMSPESVLYGRFTLESDIWAYGILLWEIYTFGRQPYYGHSNEEVVQLILDGVLLCPPSDCPPLICQMMVGCWKSDPKDRLRFQMICEKFHIDCKENQERNNDDTGYEIAQPKDTRVEYMEVV